MNPGTVRRLLHAVHAGSTVVLVGTGALIHWPELRGRVLGGYGLSLAAVHEWVGFAFMAAPLAAIGLAARALLRDLAGRLDASDPPSWKKLHIVLSLVLSALLSLSGVALWAQAALPLTVADLALDAHLWLSALLAISLPIHLWVARKKIVDIVAVRLGLRPPPEIEPPFDEP